jgi:hypothetical protein
MKTPVKAKSSAVKLKSATPLKLKSPDVTPVEKVEDEVVEDEVVEEPTEDPADGSVVEGDSKPKRQRPKNRPFLEVHDQLTEELESAYKLLQGCVKHARALKAAHKRDVSHSRNRESTARTPTLVLDEVFINYLRSRLSPEEFHITRTVGGEKVKIDLSALTPDTPVHRTDVTQLYCNVFAKHDLKDPQDGRKIMYQKDKDLVKLLTTGVTNDELLGSVKDIKDGNYALNIFNIQKFTSQYLHKVKTDSE